MSTRIAVAGAIALVLGLAACGRVGFDAADDAAATSDSSLPVCGNGAITSGEECDDGNTSAGDGCAACMLEDQGPGGTSCAAPNRLELIDVGEGRRAARASGTTIGDFDTLRSTCIPAVASPEAIYQLDVPTAGTLVLRVVPSVVDNGDALIYVRGGAGGALACAQPNSELACIDDGNTLAEETATLVVAPGTYVAIIELLRNGDPATPGARYKLFAELAP